MTDTQLHIGQIDYLNVLPLFHHLKRIFPGEESVKYIPGHPSEMNTLLAQGKLDLAPASCFEYLRDAEKYTLLPDLSIIASDGPVKSVLLVSPVPLAELPQWLKANGNSINLTSASATSVALLKVLWNNFWNMPKTEWNTIPPGTGLKHERPFLEIGNLALQNYLSPPKGWHTIDLADEWMRHTGLPFVFAVWIVRRGLSQRQQELLSDVHTALMHCKATCDEAVAEIGGLQELTTWISPDGIEDYLSTIGYDLGPEAQASLTLFGKHCTDIGLIDGMPAMRWAL